MKKVVPITKELYEKLRWRGQELTVELLDKPHLFFYNMGNEQYGVFFYENHKQSSETLGSICIEEHFCIPVL